MEESSIVGLQRWDLPVFGDNRGWFKENWQRAKMIEMGLPDLGPVQNNISFNRTAGTTRGIHAEPWDKYISVATGSVFGAWVDLRNGPGFGSVYTTIIDPSVAVFVPRGVGNAFQTLEDSTAYSYLVNEHWSPTAEYTFLNLADETAAIDWPIPLDQAELSEKDRAHPKLVDVVPMSF
jgi:dTDP-4-dehydrorhamnose 3,5-epimerase